MKVSGFGRYVLSCCVATEMLAGCSRLQPPIGAPGVMPQNLKMKRLLIHRGLVILIFSIAITSSNVGVKVSASPMVPTAETLAGVRLGDTPAMVIAAHPNAKQARTAQGATLAWNTAEGGVTVLMGATGGIAQIDFKADESKDYSIDLPCIGQFPIHDSHVNLGFALEQSNCGSIDETGTYKLIDGSVVTVTFEDSGDGPLRGAVWYWPEKGQVSKPSQPVQSPPRASARLGAREAASR
jgi:hypothetical protein